MLRKLSAIEIAEGALLADIAVVFQMLTIYLPVGGDFFRVLSFIVFAVLVLRRGLYVGIMGMCVAIFIIGVVTGPQFLVGMLLEGMGGLFLGFTMKRRFHHIPLLLLGITSGAFTLYVIILLIFLLFGLPFSNVIRGLHDAYAIVIGIIDWVAANVGLGAWWKHTLYPPIASLVALAFTYWLILFYVALWVILCPVVIVIYAVTNVFVRTLGYDVRPFPDGKANKLMRRFSRSLLKMGLRRGILKRQGAKA